MSKNSEIEAMLETLNDIKSRKQAESVPRTREASGTSRSAGDCWECGSSDIKREVVDGYGSNQTKTRHVGGKNMRVLHVCRDCGHSW